MNAPLTRRFVIDGDGRIGSPADAWRDFIASERARPIVGHAHAPEGLGRQARRLFRDFHLYDKPRHPAVPLLHWPLLRQVALAAHAGYCWAKLATAVARAHRRTAAAQAWDIARLAWREGLDAQTYYMQELYRAGRDRRAAETLTRYETKNGLFTALKRLAPRHAAERHPLGDKLAFHTRCRRHQVAAVPVYLTAIRGELAMVQSGIAAGQDLFVKPRHGKGARDTTLLRYAGAGAYRLPDGRVLSLDAYLDELARRSEKADYLVQPRLVNHADIADLATQSLIVIRVITCLDSAGVPQVTHGMLRVIGKLERSWNDSTEYAAPIDLMTGRMGAMTGDKLAGVLGWHDRHPVTGAPVSGRLLKAWPDVQAAAIRAHAAFTDRILLGWDIAVTPEGIVIVEGNAMPDVAFLQRVHRQPIGQSPLAPLLRHHLNRLEWQR
ncbi:sugar-transfer associated ATP-grasp domain-containing protein [Dongia rigui]|uniref:Sugar-transfer associated ATP-grasp domain-containing protein n=1 Tax=Dongia rigui TaxID=940149 RepID=A0ABU5DVZ5_9PROT|nr:sugar-transfer associated ATP-grasp domain-containing protein [Dongia rigui]MDY0871449.1 sugar-transfer associated ATP-grasp domain-containing protein [Dongia rigui]